MTQAEIPPALRDRVSWEGDTLLFRQDAGTLLTRTLGRLQALAHDRIQPQTAVRVSQRGVFVGLSRRVVPHQGQAVRLRGEPGGHLTLFLNGSSEALLQVFPQPPGTRPWTTQHVLWLGRTLAQLLGLPRWVEWDRTAWARWNQDPVFRGRSRLQQLRRQSEHRYSTLHGYALEEPPGEVELDRAVYQVRQSTFTPVRIELDDLGVQTDRWTVPWDALDGVAALFEPGLGRDRPDGILRVCFREQLLDLLVLHDLQELEGVYLRWLEHTLRSRARAYVRPDPGSSDEIPEPLRRLRD